MTPYDTQLPRPCVPTQPGPDAAELAALLRDLGGLRLLLSTDLCVAAAAVEADAADLADAVLTRNRTDLRGFEERALRHLGERAQG